MEVCTKKDKSGYLGNEPRRQRAGLVALSGSAIKSCPFNRNKRKNKQMGCNQTCKLLHSKEKQKTINRIEAMLEEVIAWNLSKLTVETKLSHNIKNPNRTQAR